MKTTGKREGGEVNGAAGCAGARTPCPRPRRRGGNGVSKREVSERGEGEWTPGRDRGGTPYPPPHSTHRNHTYQHTSLLTPYQEHGDLVPHVLHLGAGGDEGPVALFNLQQPALEREVLGGVGALELGLQALGCTGEVFSQEQGTHYWNVP